MIRKILAFLALSLFILLSATIVKGAENNIKLKVKVNTNIHSYFKNGEFTAETNGPDALLIKQGFNIKGETQYTITPEL